MSVLDTRKFMSVRLRDDLCARRRMLSIDESSVSRNMTTHDSLPSGGVVVP